MTETRMNVFARCVDNEIRKRGAYVVSVANA
jgi:hypothetical protein